MATWKSMTTNFFSTLSFVADFWIRDPRSGDPEWVKIRIPDPQHWNILLLFYLNVYLFQKYLPCHFWAILQAPEWDVSYLSINSIRTYRSILLTPTGTWSISIFHNFVTPIERLWLLPCFSPNRALGTVSGKYLKSNYWQTVI